MNQPGHGRSSHRAGHDYLPAVRHDRYLPFYDALSVVFGVRALHRRLLDLAELAGAPRVLEIGCGTGNLLVAARRRHPGAELVGIDPDPLALARATRKTERLTRRTGGPRIRVDHGYAQRLPYPDRSVDGALSALMLHHLDPEVRGHALAEARRVLRPGGALYLLDLGGPRPASEGPMSRLRPCRHRLAGNPSEEVVELLGQAGFVGPTVLAQEVGRLGPVSYFRGGG